jgi:hypothetical protein
MALNSSPAKWDALPMPAEAKSAHALANLKRAAVSSEVRYDLSAPMSAAPLSRPAVASVK